MSASAACGVAGTEAFTFSFGLSSGILPKLAGSFPPGTYSHGPFSDDALNQRPEIRM